MTSTDRLAVLVAAGAIVATIATGQCSTNARFSDVNARIDDVTRRMDAGHAEIRADIRELRALVVEAIRANRPEDEGK